MNASPIEKDKEFMRKIKPGPPSCSFRFKYLLEKAFDSENRVKSGDQNVQMFCLVIQRLSTGLATLGKWINRC